MHPFLLRKGTALLALTAALSFTSCKKESTTENPQPNPAPSSQIKKITSSDAVVEFGYAENKLKSIRTNVDGVANGEPTTFNITYANNGQIAALTAGDGSRIVPTYANGQLSTVSFHDAQSNAQMTARYQFEDSQLKSVTASVNNMEFFKFSYEYNGDGNVRRMTNWMLNPMSGQLEPAGYTDYTYDNKTNPLHAHKQLMYLLLQNTARFNTSTETEFDEQNQQGEKTEYSYQYNSQNLPQSATVKVTAPGQVPSTSTITFSYQ